MYTREALGKLGFERKIIWKNYIKILYCVRTHVLRLRVFENRVLRRVFGCKRDEVTGNGENYIMRSLGICTPCPILCGW
jgi:hypothetical protein